MNLRSSLLAVVFIAAAGAATAWWVTHDRAQAYSSTGRIGSAVGDRLAELADSGAVDPQLLDTLMSLEDALAEQTARTEALAQKVALLEARRELPPGALDGDQSAHSAAGDEADDDEQPGPQRAFGGQRGETVEIERLIAAGIDPIDAAEIAAAVDKITLDRLRLRYETARNGDLGSTKYREALAEIPNPREFVQEQYGDDAYDSYLYASGRPNRVIVTDVLQESPAHQIGLQAGDVLISLDDQRIYSSRDIMSIASASAGSVPLAIRRDGQILQYYVEPGPLGVRSRRGFENPDPEGE
jgi:hypothetical protein